MLPGDDPSDPHPHITENPKDDNDYALLSKDATLIIREIRKLDSMESERATIKAIALLLNRCAASLDASGREG